MSVIVIRVPKHSVSQKHKYIGKSLRLTEMCTRVGIRLERISTKYLPLNKQYYVDIF